MGQHGADGALPEGLGVVVWAELLANADWTGHLHPYIVPYKTLVISRSSAETSRPSVLALALHFRPGVGCMVRFSDLHSRCLHIHVGVSSAPSGNNDAMIRSKATLMLQPSVAQINAEYMWPPIQRHDQHVRSQKVVLKGIPVNNEPIRAMLD